MEFSAGVGAVGGTQKKNPSPFCWPRKTLSITQNVTPSHAQIYACNLPFYPCFYPYAQIIKKREMGECE